MSEWGIVNMIGENVNIKGNCVARALYDNIAESPDELPFRKGDLLTVLEQNTGGLEGWWLCSLKGRQGICPGNRLRIVPGCYDTGSGITSLSNIHQSAQNITQATRKVVTPKRFGDVYIYDSPKSHIPQHQNTPTIQSPFSGNENARLFRSSSLRTDAPKIIARNSLEHYDSPRPLENQYDSPRPVYDIPKSSVMHYDLPKHEIPKIINEAPKTLIKGLKSFQSQEYDIPKPNDKVDRTSKISLMSVDSQTSVSSTASSIPASESLSLSSVEGSSNRSSIESHDLYDIPPEPKLVKPKLPPREEKKSNLDVVYDVPPQVCREQPEVDSILNRLSSGSDSSGIDLEIVGIRELPLELNAAKETLVKYEQELYLHLEKFIEWKKRISEPNFEELKTLVLKVKNSVNEVLNFARGSIGNSVKIGNNVLSKKILKHMEPIESTYAIVCQSCNKLKTEPINIQSAKIREHALEVSSVIVSLRENVRHLCNTIQAHSHLIFKRSPIIEFTKSESDKTPVQDRPLPAIPTEKLHQENEWLEEYDYINLNTKIEKDEKHLDNIDKKIDNLTANIKPNLNVTEPKLTSNDNQILNFYGTQAKLHLQNLNAAIDAFLLTIENNQPPKVFITHSKFVVLSAHKMVFIGDTVHRNLANGEIRSLILNCSNELCDAMKKTVDCAKNAALHFPSVTSVQSMVDAFVSISQLANKLKMSICRS